LTAADPDAARCGRQDDGRASQRHGTSTSPHQHSATSSATAFDLCGDRTCGHKPVVRAEADESGSYSGSE
jgi:hypothetical protein